MKVSLYAGINSGSLIFVECHSKLVGINRKHCIGISTVSFIILSIIRERVGDKNVGIHSGSLIFTEHHIIIQYL